MSSSGWSQAGTSACSSPNPRTLERAARALGEVTLEGVQMSQRVEDHRAEHRVDGDVP